LHTTTIIVLSDDGPVRSQACANLVFKYIILNLATVVCIGWKNMKEPEL